MSIRILIADDHALFREMLHATLTNKGKDYDVVGQAADGEQTLNLVTRHHPDLLLLDYKMPGLHGLSAFCQEVARRSSTTRILLLSGFREEEIGMEAAIGGARGYLSKGAPIADLLTAIDIIHEGGIWVDSYLPRYVFNTFLRHGRYGAKNLIKLTPQELKVLSLVAHGMGNDKIGTRLYISEKTVKNHLTHIFAKLRVRGRQQAVDYFLAPGESNYFPLEGFLRQPRHLGGSWL